MLYKKVSYKYGNINKHLTVEVSCRTVSCPICSSWTDAEVDDDGDIENFDCECNIGEYTHDVDIDDIKIDAYREGFDSRDHEVDALRERVLKLEAMLEEK